MGDQTSVSSSAAVSSPEDVEGFRRLESELRESQDWQGLRELYRRHASEFDDQEIALEELAEHLGELADEVDDESEAAEIQIALGDLYAHQLDRMKDAKQTYRSAFVTDTTNTESLDRARAIYRSEGNYKLVTKLYELEEQVTADGPRKAEILFCKALAQGDHLGSLDAAKANLEQARELQPENELIDEVLEIYQSGGTVEAAVDDTFRLAEDARSGGDLSLAGRLYFKAGRLEARREGGDDERASELLERALQADGELEVGDELLDAYDIEVPGDAEEDPGSEADAEAEASEQELRETAELPEDAVVGDLADGGEVEDVVHEEAVETAEVPSDGAAEADRDAIEEDAETVDVDAEPAVEEQPEAQEQQAEAAESGETDESDGSDEGEEGDDAGGLDTDGDVEAFYASVPEFSGGVEEARETLDDDPADLAALKCVRADLKASGDDEAWAERLEEAVKRRRKKEGEGQLMAELANLYWRELGEVDEAEYYFKRLKVLDAEHPDVFEFYEAYYTEQEDWRRLFSHLKKREEKVDEPAERRRLASRRAEVAEQEMNSPEKAIDVWKNYLRRHDEAEARRELRRLYEAYEKWNGLVDFLKDEARRLEDEEADNGVERVEILEQMAELYEEEIGHQVMATNTLREILEIDPGHREAFDRLRDKLVSNRRWNDLADLLENRAEKLVEREETAEAADLMAEVAEIHDDKMKHTSRAVPFYERVVELAPQREGPRERLAEIYESRRDWESLLDLRERELDFREGQQRFEQLRTMLGLVRQKIGNWERAIPILEELVDWEPDDLELVEQLEEAYRETEAHAELAELLERKAELADGEAGRVDALAEAAKLVQKKLNDIGRAIGLWERVLREEPEHEEAVSHLTNLYLEGQQWDELTRLYNELGRFDRLFDLFDSAAEMAGEEKTQQELYERMAALAEEQLDDTERVIISLESLREVAEDPAAVAERLAQWYHRAGELGSEIEMLEQVLKAADGAERESTLARMVDLEAERGEAGQALERQIQLLESDSSREGALERAEALADESDGHARLVESLDLLVEDIDTEALRVEVYRVMGRLERDELERPDAAAAHLEQLLDARPDDEPALAALADLYEQQGHWEAFVEAGQALVELRREAGADDAEVLDPLARVARVQHSEMEDSEGAREGFEAILEIDPDFLPAIRGLADIARDHQAWSTVVEMLQHELALVELDDEQREREVQFELAEVYRTKLEEYDEALHYYRQILEVDPDFEDARRAVQSLLDEEGQARSAALLLEPILREREDWEALAEAIEARRRAVDDRFEEFEALEELIELYANRLDDAQTAFERAERQFELSPDREDVWARLEELAEPEGRWSAVEDLYMLGLEDEEVGPDAEEGLLERLAHLRRDRLEDPEGAVESFEALWERRADDETGAALEALYRQMERYEELVDVLERRAEATVDEDKRIDFLEQAATIWEDILEEPDGAIECHRQITELDPAAEASMKALGRLYRRTERWAALEELYERRLEQAFEPDQRRDLQVELAEVRSHKLEDFVGAESILTDLVRENPDDEGVVEALEELEVQLIKSGSSHFELRVDIARALEPIYRERGDASRLVDVLSVRLRGTEDPLEQVDLLDELARLNDEQLDEPLAAFQHLTDAVPLDPEGEERREKLENIGRRLEKLETVVETLEEAADRADPYAATPIVKRIGMLNNRELERPEAAMEAFERVLDYDESDEEALAALEELYEQQDRPEQLADVLRKRVSYGDAERRSERLSRLGRLEWETLERPDEAIEAYRQLLDTEPDSLEALEALRELYELRGDSLELAEILRRQAEVVADVDERIEILCELAGVYEEELHDIDEAIVVWEDVLSADPMRVETLDALERLYRQTDRWADVADVMRKRLVTEEGEDLERRTEIEVELAEILRTKLYETENAIELYRVVLGRQAAHPTAMEALEELLEDPGYAAEVAEDLIEQYRQQESWQDLVDLYRLRVDQEADPERRAELHRKMGEIHQEGLDDPEAALDAFAEAWALQPSDDGLRDTLELLADELEARARLAQIYRDVVAEVSDPQQRVDMHLRLAEIEETHLEDPLEAEEHYRQALTIDERAWTAYASLESLLEADERWLDLVELLERKLDVARTADEESVRDLLARVAVLQEVRVEDPFAAVEAWERLLEVAPEDEDAFEALGRLYRNQQRWEDLADLLERRLATLEADDEGTEVAFELAEVQRTELYDAQRAVDLYRRVLEARPTHAGSVEALEAIFEEREQVRESAAELLEEAYRADEQWEALLELLVRRADYTDAPDAAADLLEQALELADDVLEDVERAFEVVVQLVEVAPDRQPARRRGRQLAGAVDGWERWVECYDTVLNEGLDIGPDQRAQLLVEQGQILEERLEALEEARRVYGEALLERGDHDEAVDGLERVLYRLEAWESVNDLYREQAGRVDDEEARRGWMVKSARLAEHVLGSDEMAVDTWMDLLRDYPDDTEAREAVERLFGRQGRWWDLVDLYRDEVGETDDEATAVELQFRLAQTLESQLEEIEQAIEAYGDVLERRPGHRRTMRALEGLRRDLAVRSDSWRDQRLMIISRLTGEYAIPEDWRRVVELLEEKRELIEGPKPRAELLVREADLFDEHGVDGVERGRAVDRLARAVCLTPDDEAIRERLEALAEELEAWNNVPASLLSGLEVTRDAEQRARILETVGRIYQDHLADPDSAIVAFQSAVESAPRDGALERLEGLLRERELWDSLVEVLEARVDRVADPDQRRTLLERLGSLYDEVLERPSEGARFYEELLELEPGEADYFDALESIYERTGQYEDLERLLQSRLELSEAADERERILRRLATIQDEYLDKPEASIETYRSLQDGDGNDREVVGALSRLYERTKRWSELLEILEIERDFAESLDEVNQLDFRRGQIQLEKLEHPAAAFESFREVVQRDPDYAGAQEALEELVAHPQTRRDAADFLQEMYREAQDWEALERLYDTLLTLEEDRERRGELYMELAQVHEENRERPELAFAMLGRAVREMPETTYLRRELERLSGRLDNPEEVVAVYEDTLDDGIDEWPVERQMRLEVAEFAAERLESLDTAIEYVEAILEEEPYDAEALDRIDTFYQKKGAWAQLEDVLERRLSVAEDGEAVDVRFRLGYLKEAILDDAQAGFEHYRAVLEQQSGHGGAIAGLERLVEQTEMRGSICDLLEPIYEQQDSWDKLVQLLRLRLEIVEDERERAQLNRRIAHLELEHRGHPDLGYAFLGRALRADPFDEEIQEELEELAEEHGYYDQIVALYEELLDSMTDPIRVVELAERAAGWAKDELGEPDRAVELYWVILDIEPEHEAALDGLEAVARQEGRTEDLADVLKRQVDVIFDPDEQRELYLEIGELRTSLDEFGEAAEAYRAALLLDESDTEVMEKLVGLYEVTEQYDELVDVLERLTGYVVDSEELVRLNTQIAQYSKVFLEDEERAIDAFQQVLQQDPDNERALAELESLYEGQERWSSLRDVLVRAYDSVEEAGNVEEMVRLSVKLGELAYQQFGDRPEAMEWYQRALELQPEAESVIAALDELYRSEGQWDDLLALYETQLEMADSAERQAELYVDLAEISLEERDDEAQAGRYLDEAFELDPDSDRALKMDGELCRREENWEGLLDVLDRRLELVEVPEREIEIRLERARRLEEEFEQPDEAIADYRRILEIEPLNDEALGAVKRLYRQSQNFHALFDVLEHEAQHVDSEAEAVELYEQMAELAEQKMDSPELGIQALDRAYELRPADLDIAEQLIHKLMEVGRLDDARPLLDELVDRLEADGSDEEIVRLLHMRGQLAERQGDYDAALESYEQVRSRDNEFIPNLLSLGKLAYRQGNFDDAKNTFQKLLLHQMKLESDAQKVDVYYYLGLIRKEMGDGRRAKDMFNRALSIDPDHEPSQTAMSEL